MWIILGVTILAALEVIGYAIAGEWSKARRIVNDPFGDGS